MRNADWNFIALVVAFCIATWSILDYGKSKNEAQAQHDHYCDMVQIYKDSQGAYDWPNYENRECN